MGSLGVYMVEGVGICVIVFDGYMVFNNYRGSLIYRIYKV